MANPFKDLKTAACSAAGAVSGVGVGLGTDGRTEKEMAAEAARRRSQGATVFCRVTGGERMESPRRADRADTQLAFAVACPNAGGTGSALDQAYEIAWALYAAVRNQSLGLDWLNRPLAWLDWELVYDSQTCAIISILFETNFDMSSYGSSG